MPEISFAPPEAPISVVRGDSFEIGQLLTTLDGDLPNLAGYTVATEVDQPVGADLAPVTVIDGAEVIVSMTPAETAALETGSLLVTKLTGPGGDFVRTVIYGRIYLLTLDAA